MPPVSEKTSAAWYRAAVGEVWWKERVVWARIRLDVGPTFQIGLMDRIGLVGVTLLLLLVCSRSSKKNHQVGRLWTFRAYRRSVSPRDEALFIGWSTSQGSCAG